MSEEKSTDALENLFVVLGKVSVENTHLVRNSKALVTEKNLKNKMLLVSFIRSDRGRREVGAREVLDLSENECSKNPMVPSNISKYVIGSNH